MKVYALALIIALIAPTAVVAERRVAVEVAIAESPGIPDAKTISIILQATKTTYRRQLGINLDYHITQLKNRRPSSFMEAGELVWRWHKKLVENNWTNRNLLLAIAGPVIEPAGAYYWGHATSLCQYNGTMPRGIAVTFLGASRHHPIERAAAYVVHELGHLMGANHDWQIPATAMHPDFDGSVYWLDSDAPEIRFSKNSKNEIKKCLKGEKTELSI